MAHDSPPCSKSFLWGKCGKELLEQNKRAPTVSIHWKSNPVRRTKLVVHVPQSEFTLGHFLHEFLLLLAVALHGLHQSAQISKPHQFRDERLGVKGIQVVKVLAGAGKNNGTARGRHRRQRPTAFGVPIQPGKK